MNFDVTIAGWILSLITFLLGTITPVIYRRLSFDGFTIKQLFDFNVLTPTYSSDEKGENGYGVVEYSTAIKIANAQKDSVLINDVRFSRIKTKGIIFTPFDSHHRLTMRFYEAGEPLHFPPSISTKKNEKRIYADPPFIIKSDEEKIIVVGLKFTYKPNLGWEATSNALFAHMAKKGIKLSFQINGKYRSFTLKFLQKGYDKSKD